MSRALSSDENGSKQLDMSDFPPLDGMSQDEKLDEIATSLREVKVALAAFQNIGPSGIFKMLMGGGK